MTARVAALYLGAVAFGCRNGPDVTPPKGLTLCALPLTVSVTGPIPELRWSPACGATYLEVTTADKQTVLWAVRADTGKIAAGVVYGQPPPGTEVRFGPTALTRGIPYLARVGITVDEDSFFILGEGAFTP